ncbi:hypothetical protein [Pseudoalteromonas sp. Of7M-16]|nr:hypothetical protein [Pseudoalteromonas sp. Of7M-16]MCG7549192.1 hypothetical protein [Pseudoalteromonas sp. Of7M-16]
MNTIQTDGSTLVQIAGDNSDNIVLSDSMAVTRVSYLDKNTFAFRHSKVS